MKDYLILLLDKLGAPVTPIFVSAYIICFIILTAVFVHIILHFIILRQIKAFNKRKDDVFTSCLLEFDLFSKLAFTLQGVIIYLQITLWVSKESGTYEFLHVLSTIWIVVFSILSLYSIINTVFKALQKNPKTAPFAIQGIAQSLKLIIAIIAAIYIISLLINKSPIVIFSGLGAMTAVLMLVFKDPILGLVAGLQISTNNMLKVGDWVEMPKYGADGDVIDIALTTVKVQNWDKTITTIPTYAFVSDSFKNWRGMKDSGGRRIKRSINIDINSIGFLSDEDIKKLSKADILSEYILKKQKEIESYNKSRQLELSAINARRLTNVGTYRTYLENYLKNHPKIRSDMTLMVRHLASSQYGLPIEIYCFTNTVVWIEYEHIQADIFDHALAVSKEFNLKIHQVS
ncbi:MAG: mechanosensitive ion channel family protein [Campylobacteraceae bacterium]|nr:mechanosensitive ion channel family protein [Campylobacteraceae bacterium]